ncbi:unnamed protein product, partial [Prorocentrum cordatum]
ALASMKARWGMASPVPINTAARLSDDQLSVIACLCEIRLNILACDLVIWGPRDSRCQRITAITAHHRNDNGEWIPRRFDGPGCVDDWLGAWNFAVSGCQAAGCIDKAIAEAYRDHSASMARSFPGADAWALCVESDWTFRFEFAPDERDRQAAAYAQAPQFLYYDAEKPWNAATPTLAESQAAAVSQTAGAEGPQKRAVDARAGRWGSQSNAPPTPSRQESSCPERSPGGRRHWFERTAT